MRKPIFLTQNETSGFFSQMQRRRVTETQTIATARGSEVGPYGIKRKWIDFRSEKRNNQNTKSSTSVKKRKSKRKTVEEAKRGRWTSAATCGNTRSPQQTEAEGFFLLRRLVLDCWKQSLQRYRHCFDMCRWPSLSR